MKKFGLFILGLILMAGIAVADYCPRCKFYNDDAASFCSNCGLPLRQQPQVIVCPRCSFENPYGVFFCSRCGLDLRQPPPPPVVPPAPEGLEAIFGSQPHHHHEGDHPKEEERPKAPRLGLIGTLVNNGADILPYNGPVHHIHFKCTQGDLIINTMNVHENKHKNELPVLLRLKAGQEADKELPKTYNAIGLWFSHRGSGTVEIYAQ